MQSIKLYLLIRASIEDMGFIPQVWTFRLFTCGAQGRVKMKDEEFLTRVEKIPDSI